MSADIGNPARKTDAGTKLLSRGTDAETKLLNRQPAEQQPTAGKKPSEKVTSPVQAIRKSYPDVQGGGKWIWAYRSNSGPWGPNKATGWDPTFEINTLQELVEGLKKRGLEGQVAKLAIVAHGDQPGVVQLQPLLTHQNVANFKSEFSQLNGFLKPNGKLLFESCVAGKWDAGSTLLKEVSRLLPNIYVIGFEIVGGRAMQRSDPGQIYEKVEGLSTGTPKIPVWLNEYSQFSKWALNGEVIRFDQGDQSKRPNKKCANPTCPGHAQAAHKCDFWP